MFVGFTALSVEIRTNFFTPAAAAACDLIRSLNVIFDRLVRAVFHKRHMFVRCRVEHDIRMISLHNTLHTPGIAHGSDQRHQIKPRVFPPQLLLDGIGIIFINVENDQHRRFGLGDLAAELAADGSAPARYQDGLAFQCGEDLVVVDLYLGAAQQVRDLHVAQLADADFSVDQLVGCRYGLHLTAGVFTYIEDGLPVFTGRGRNCVDDTGDPVLFYFLLDVVAVAHDRHAFQHTAFFVQVVVDHAADFSVQVAAAHQLTDERQAACPPPMIMIRSIPSSLSSFVLCR